LLGEQLQVDQGAMDVLRHEFDLHHVSIPWSVARSPAGSRSRNVEGLIMLNELFEQGVAVKILEGIAAGEHTERSLILALAEDRRRDIVRKTRNGLESAARQGRTGGRPRVINEDKRRAILARRAEGQSPREISRGVGVSLAVVHGEVVTAETREGSATSQATSTSEI
jgi:DNA invertase Pin-like site-specific DNA recombinase